MYFIVNLHAYCILHCPQFNFIHGDSFEFYYCFYDGISHEATSVLVSLVNNLKQELPRTSTGMSSLCLTPHLAADTHFDHPFGKN